MVDPVEEAADRLYGLPLEDFVTERGAAAKELRKAGEKDAAAQVAKLPKPSQVAGVVNRLAREGGLDELLEAGERLRAAQLGGGSREDVRAAAAAERAAVDAVVRDVEGLSQSLSDRLRTTLHAAALDESVRELISAGRLVAEPEGGGAWPLGAVAAPGPERRQGREAKPRDRAAEKKRERDLRERERQEREQERQAEEDERREQAERKRADQERRDLERRLRDARVAAEEAQERLEQAKAEYESACDEVARIEEQLS